MLIAIKCDNVFRDSYTFDVKTIYNHIYNHNSCKYFCVSNI